MIIANENTKYQLKQIITEIIYILNTELKQRTHMRMIVFPLVTFQSSIYLGGRESALTLPPKISKTYSADLQQTNKHKNIQYIL